MPGRRIARQSLLDGEHPEATPRHVVLDTYIIAGRQRILDALPKSGCAAAQTFGSVGKSRGALSWRPSAIQL